MKNTKTNKYSGKELLVQSLVFALLWFLYMAFIFPHAFISIDKCSGTPDTDSSRVIIILVIYLLIFGAMLFYLTRHFKHNLTRLISILLFTTLLPYLYVLGTFILLAIENMEVLARKLNIWKYIYFHGCYNDIEVHETPVFLASSAFLFGSLFLFLKFSVRKNFNKNV